MYTLSPFTVTDKSSLAGDTSQFHASRATTPSAS